MGRNIRVRGKLAPDEGLSDEAQGTQTGEIANKAVTYAKIQDVSATNKLLGRSTAGAGVVEEIACTAAGRALLDDADASAQRDTLGLGDMATKDNVGLGDLAAGISPSHIVVYAGNFITAGGDVNESASIPGVLATDTVIATLNTQGQVAVTLVSAKAKEGGIDFVMSADPDDDHQISYMVLRAAA